MRASPAVLLNVLLAVLLPFAAAAPVAAQAPGHSTGDWKRLETENFLFLYPEELAGWALPMAERMESVRTAVQALVGYAPEDRVTVLVDDPSNVSNGSMSPGPILFMWPTPPNPRSMIGENRGWGEILAVHEFAHAAHLTRPSRDPWERFRTSLLPLPVTRIMRESPRWVTEGYATYVEGRLTGAGRPHGVWRPAVLRTWALEGQLPSYGQISSSGGFYGGAFAYLAGSAFLEWLVAREGGDDRLLPNVWARLTARQERSFDAAFTGVFGYPAPELYGLFSVDVTENALAVRDAVEAAGGVVDGELFQRLSWYTGDPAASPDGERLAVALRSRDTPSRLVVMSTTPDTLPTRVRERQAEILEEDPEDVAPVQRRPRSQRALATLWPEAGAGYDAPAWMPGGEGILVVRSAFIGNERTRPDLFLWDWEDGGVRRITHGEGVREADPSPDGTWAAGLRCLNARCDVVRIDLSTGAVTLVAAGDELSPWFRPRVSPDGRTIVASRQVGDRWRLAAMDADGSDLRWIDPEDGASRFDAEFLEAGRVVLTSTASGIPQLETLDLRSGEARPLTRVLGAAVAPTSTPAGDVFFLSLHSRGWDLRRIALDSAATTAVRVDPGLTPAAAVPPVPADTFEVVPLGPVRGYGLGPRFMMPLPVGIAAPDAFAAGGVLNSTDPIGIFSWQVRGLYGEELAFRGGAADLVWRGWAPELRLGGFLVGGPVPGPGSAVLPVTGDPLEEAYFGGLATVALERARLGRRHRLVLGGSAGELAGTSRVLGWADLAAGRLRTPGLLRITRTLGVHGAAGRTGAADWSRLLVSGSLEVGRSDQSLGISGFMGYAKAAAASGERFRVGGTSMLLLDPAVLSQRIPMPALPEGFMGGDEVWGGRAELRNGESALFYWIGDARGDALGRQQLIGLDTGGDVPAIHYVRLPAVHVRAGVARLLDEPLQNEWRGWLVFGVRP